jgi:hypothetical protein
MSQLTLIILCALAMGVSAAFATWLSIDVAGWLGKYLSARKERKRLEAEAKALQEAEAEGAKDDDKA